MIRVVHPGSRIPDPGVKKVPNPGSRIRIRNTELQSTLEKMDRLQRDYAGKEGVGINNAHRKGWRQWRENKDIMRERMK